MKKRILCLILASVMILLSLPFGTYAEGEDGGEAETENPPLEEDSCAHEWGAWTFEESALGVTMSRPCALCGEKDALSALWESGSIDFASGEDLENACACRTKDPLPLDLLTLAVPGEGCCFSFFAYDSEGRYLGNGSFDASERFWGDGNGVSAEKIRSLYPDALSVRAVLRKTDLSDFPVNDVISSGVRLYGVSDALPVAGLPAPEDFEPVLRFAVTSDVHIRNASANLLSSELLDRFLWAVYAYSDAQTGYKGLDGVFFTGDNTQTASEEEQRYFFETVASALREGTVTRAVMGNHEFFSTGRYTEESFALAPENFKVYSGYDSPDAHFVLGGYHFIFLSNDVYAPGAAFSEEKLAWLESELDAAVTEDESGQKPIFVFQHEPPEGAVGGAVTYASDRALSTLLSNYPQVVDFSGHTHFPMTGPYSVWQDDFTAVALGSLCFSLIPIVNHPLYGDTGVFGDLDYGDYPGVCPFDKKGGWIGISEASPRSGELFCFAEVDAQDRVRLVLCDIYTGTAVGDPIWIGRVGDPGAFNLTAARSYTATRPEFDKDAAVRLLSSGPDVLRVAVPQASCKSDPVQNYRADLYKDGALVGSLYALGDDFFASDVPDEIEFAFSSLDPSTDYLLKIHAVSYWGLCSEPLAAVFKTKDADAREILLSAAFTPDGVFNAADGCVLPAAGDPRVIYDSDIERYVAELDGNSGYVWSDVRSLYGVLSRSASAETAIRLDALPEQTVDLFSGMEYGGFGFELNASGRVSFLMNLGGSYYRVSAENLPVGEYVHLLAVYDGASLALYVNGVLAQINRKISGALTLPKEYGQVLCVGGDPTTGGLMSKFTAGRIAEARLYGYALTPEEAAARFSEWREKKEEHRHEYVDGFCTVCGEEEPAAEPLPFDLDGDGAFGIKDVSFLLDVLAGVREENDLPDPDGSGVLDISDAAVLLDLLASAKNESGAPGSD